MEAEGRKASAAAEAAGTPSEPMAIQLL